MSSEKRLFGTDGIRGAFGEAPLDRDTVFRVARAVVGFLRDQGHEGPRIVIGGDTRESTPTISEWLEDALDSLGAEPLRVGVIPTPGVAFLVRALAAHAGIVVSASHNPYPDNGIKILDARGFKLEVVAEGELEKRIRAQPGSTSPPPAAASGGRPRNAEGRGSRTSEPLSRYLESLGSSLPGPTPLRDLSVVLDTGNGAASFIAAELFEGLGARVEMLNNVPDGRNVNRQCGSTAPEEAASRVASLGYDLGFAFDGDADRVVLCDERGEVRDGDEILFLWARELKEAGELSPPAIVATSMSNLGLERALSVHGVDVVRCDVGDRQVVHVLKEHGLRLGGEQSGHIVDLRLGTTGDGLLTALQIAYIVNHSQAQLSDLLTGFERFPQILISVPVRSKPPFDELAKVSEVAHLIETDLGTAGRLVLRYSGTEQLARIMIEGPDAAGVEAKAGRLAAAIEEEIGRGATGVTD